ncbi:MAG: hypothetical protein ABIT71_07270 [Vicinamibacteraceae bacterium]
MSRVVSTKVNFVSVTWRDYNGQVLIFRNYNPDDFAQIWGANHIAAGTERGIVARIDYTRGAVAGLGAGRDVRPGRLRQHHQLQRDVPRQRRRSAVSASLAVRREPAGGVGDEGELLR